jgi:hypothetical protein
MKEITDALVQSYQTFFTQLSAFLPKLIGFVLILIFGWIIAKIIRAVSVRLLAVVRLNVLTEKAKIDQFLSEGGIKQSAIEIIGTLFYWLIMLIVIVAAFNSLGLRVASELFNQVILFIPNIIVSIFVLILGLFLANFTRQVVVTYCRNVGIQNADTMGKIAQYAIVIFVVSIALTQMNIGEEILTNLIVVLFGAVCLALALAFGLGGRDWASRVIEKFWGE